MASHIDWNESIERIRKLADSNPKFLAIIKDLANAQKVFPRSDLERRRAAIKANLSVTLTRDEITEGYRALFAKTSVGKLDDVWGRGRNASFIWAKGLSYRELCREVLGLGIRATPSDGATGASGGLLVRVNLKSGRSLELTVDEARELKDELSCL
jgi:hypothetical protein